MEKIGHITALWPRDGEIQRLREKTVTENLQRKQRETTLSICPRESINGFVYGYVFRRFKSSPVGSSRRVVVNEAVISMRNKVHEIGIWNFRGFLIIEKELHRTNTAVLEMAQTHWNDGEYFRTYAGNVMYTSGNGLESRNGVAVLVSKLWVDAVTEHRPISDK